MAVSDLNLCQFTGRLGADPDVRNTANGEVVVSARLANNRRWKSKSGEFQEATEWVGLTFFGPVAQIAEKYLRKGSRVLVHGQFRTRKWQDKDGQDRYTTEIVVSDLWLLDGVSDDKHQPQSGTQQRPPHARPSRPNSPDRAGPPSGYALDDDIPF